MANITETDTYDAGVYLLATTDPVQGGAGGASNAPLVNLANRTHYLNKRAFGINQTQTKIQADFNTSYANTTSRPVYWTIYLKASSSTGQIKLSYGVEGVDYDADDVVLIDITNTAWTTIALMVGVNHKYKLTIEAGTYATTYAVGTSYTEIV